MKQFPGQRAAAILACGLIAAAAGAAVAQVATTGAGLSLNDLASMPRLATPVLSPDGAYAALVVTRPDTARNRFVSTVTVIDTRTGAQRWALVSAGASRLTWAPHGEVLAWLANDKASTAQIHLVDLKGGAKAPSVVTRAPEGAGVRAFAWSPDARSLAYLAGQLPPAPMGAARFDRSFEIPDADYLGTTYLARSAGAGPARLWLLPAQGGTPRLVSDRTAYLQDLAWQPDGKAIVVSSRTGATDVSARFTSLSSIAIDGGRETVRVAVPAGVSSDLPILMSPRGMLAYLHFQGVDPWTHVRTVSVLVDGQARDLTAALDCDAMGFDWLPGDALVVESQDHLRTGLWSVPLAGAATRLDLGPVNPVSGATTSANGKLAFIGSEIALPPELYVMSSASSRPVRLTHFNDVAASRRLGQSRAVSWTVDSYTHDGVLTLPPDFRPESSYPLLVDIHGGPHTSALHSFNGESQTYAAAGWLVFEPNYRGSDGQGDKYRSAVIGDATAGPGRDIIAGVAAVKAQGSVDAARIALTGWSYGGVMTSWLIGQRHDWCAAIPGALVVDFADYYDQSETGIWMTTILGSPHLAANRSKYLEQNPASYLDRATTPTLILHDVGDPNAPVGQSYALYHALRDNGVKAKMVLFGIDGHEPGDPLHLQQIYVRTLGWLSENCGPGKPAAPRP